jgi:hypothetical protein
LVRLAVEAAEADAAVVAAGAAGLLPVRHVAERRRGPILHPLQAELPAVVLDPAEALRRPAERAAPSLRLAGMRRRMQRSPGVVARVVAVGKAVREMLRLDPIPNSWPSRFWTRTRL